MYCLLPLPSAIMTVPLWREEASVGSGISPQHRAAAAAGGFGSGCVGAGGTHRSHLEAAGTGNHSLAWASPWRTALLKRILFCPAPRGRSAED